jgi:Zinc carboxypeptidase
MPKLFLKTTLFLVVSLSAFSQKSVSPQEYFQSEKGQNFIHHNRLVDYYTQIVNTNPKNAKMFLMGTTTENRPQLMIAISSEKNISNLEEIRTQNLKNIGLLDGTYKANIPAIAMLSYNVHGNESVSANAAPYVVYELLTGKYDDLLKNTLVLIDPCVNPDGYDRYAQWYNRYKANSEELNSVSIEHNEPWPGGRFNHYLFDMNRDVAWQTQKESQQRMKVYNSWMPHLHADFHEMSPNSTYYFPPSAKPFHEDLTAYQRAFQEKWGQYNKKRFDEKGWLYFTKENFDLLYPSYGDTYPSYNGAAGATFEQAGGGGAGAAFLRTDNDTLRLSDRIDHTIANSLSTLEAIADQSDKTIENFSNFFNETSKKGYGKYKSFVLKASGNEANIQTLCRQLDKLQIKYSFADKSSSLKGFNYISKKEEAFTLDTKDLIINTFQPKGVLTKILFEPETVVEDSNTYDVTAWSLPYAYNLKAFGIVTKLEGNLLKPATAVNKNIPANVYAFAVPISSFEDSKFLAALIKNKVKVRVHEKPFKADGQQFKPGTIIITRKGNEAFGANFGNKILDISSKFNVQLVPLQSGMVQEGADLGSGSVDYVKPIHVGLMMGAGISPTAVGDVWHYFEQQLSYPISLIDIAYMSKIDLKKVDVLILPDGSYGSAIKDLKVISDWIKEGGRLILMEQANELVAGKEGFGLKKIEEKPDTKLPKKGKLYGETERSSISDQIPGAIYKINLDNTHPLAFGYGKETYLVLRNIMEYQDLEDGWNVGNIDDKSLVSGFVGKNAKEKLKNKFVFGVEDKGRGKVIYMHESPLFRGFWEAGKLLFANAVFLVR